MGILLCAGFVGVSPAQASNPISSDDMSTAQPQGMCQVGWYYRTVSRATDPHFKIGFTHSNYNGTGSNMSSTFGAQSTGSVSVTLSGGTEVSLGVILADIAAKYHIDVVPTISVTLGNSTTITIPSKKVGNADYGAWRAHTTGVNEYFTSNCKVTKTKNIMTYSPYRVGWRTWIGAN